MDKKNPRNWFKIIIDTAQGIAAAIFIIEALLKML